MCKLHSILLHYDKMLIIFIYNRLEMVKVVVDWVLEVVKVVDWNQVLVLQVVDWILS